MLEALALGKRVVGYDCGGVREWLGTLFPAGRVPPGDRNRLLEATRSIIRDRPQPLTVERSVHAGGDVPLLRKPSIKSWSAEFLMI